MELKSLIEAILFAAQRPISLKEIKAVLTDADPSANPEMVHAFRRTREAEIAGAIEELKVDYIQQERSFQIQEVANAFHLVSQPQFAPWLKSLLDEHRRNRLSQPALETLAIIAYRQPITRADIENVRGVDVDGVMQTLLERDLIAVTGRAEVPGRPMLYGTTRIFLEYFGLRDVNELPAIEELRRVGLNPPKSSTPSAENHPLQADPAGPAQAPNP